MENLLTRRILTAFVLVVCLAGMFPLAAPPAKATDFTLTRTFYSHPDDGHIVAWNGTDFETAWRSLTGNISSNPPLMSAGQSNNTATDHYIFRGFLFFDTSVIPDGATNVSAVLSLNLVTKDGTDNITITNGQPIYPHKPLQSGDFYYEHYSDRYGTVNYTSWSAGYNNVTFSNTSMLNFAGWTKLCLRTEGDMTGTALNDSYLLFFSGDYSNSYSPRLTVTYTTDEFYQYYLFGSFNENGSNGGAINVTFYKPTQPSETFELNGEYNVTCEEDHRQVFKFDLGYNNSRVYYSYLPTENIYVIRPSEPFYTYYFTIVDYVGCQWAYLESTVNLNGTERIVERQRIDISLNNVPFTFSWGTAYTMRLVCDRGTYVYGTFMAGATNSFILAITSDMFPMTSTDISGITVNAFRYNVTRIQAAYADTDSNTTWVWIGIYEYGNDIAIYSYNTTAQTVTLNWDEAASDTDYSVMVEILHNNLGFKYWTFACPNASGISNPFSGLSFLGTFPFDASQLPAVLILVTLTLTFGWWSIPVGLMVSIVVAAIEIWLGILDVGWGWLSIAASIVFILILAEAKERDQF